MNNKDISNRSVLAMAGQRLLTENLSIQNPSRMGPKSPEITAKTQKDREKDTRIRKLMMKLTLPRLRKMQALVRGFLVRRTVYPAKLKDYLLAKAILGLIVGNVVYRDASEIILENITYLKYDPVPQQSIIGYQRILENEILNRIAQRVFHKQIVSIVETTTASLGKLVSRPKISYGFNLRDPLELLLFDRINQLIGTNYKQIVRQAIQECVAENREIRIIDEWIQKYGMMGPLYQQIVMEVLDQNIAEYIVHGLLDRVQVQGAEVVARVSYDQELTDRETKGIERVQAKLMEWVLQQGSLQAFLALGHSIQK